MDQYRTRRLGFGVAIAIGIAATLVPVAARPAQAAPCPTLRGVTVVVDFNTLSGGIQRRCFNGDPTTGLAAWCWSG